MKNGPRIQLRFSLLLAGSPIIPEVGTGVFVSFDPGGRVRSTRLWDVDEAVSVAGDLKISLCRK